MVVARGFHQRQRVFREARAAIAGAGVQEFAADAIIEADAARHFLHVGADSFAEIGDLVDEGDLHREEAVGGVLDQLRRAALGEEDRRLVQEERTIKLVHDIARALVIGAADDDAVGALEVVDRRAFAQKFGVRDDRELRVRVGFLDDGFDLIAGADRHRRFGDDDRIALHQAGDLFGGGVDVGEVGVAIAAA